MTRPLTPTGKGSPGKLSKRFCRAPRGSESRLDKVLWIRARQGEVLVYTKIGDPASRDKVFVEYLPVEVAWAPIEARNYMHINCLWTSGFLEGQGSGEKMLQRVFDDTRLLGMSGVTAITTSQKSPYLTDLSFYRHFGFEIVDEAADYLLVAKKFRTASNESAAPNFSRFVHAPIYPDKPGLYIVYTTQCPFTYHHVEETLEEARLHRVEASAHRITSAREARESPVPWTAYAAYLDGKYLGHEILTAKKLAKKLSDLNVIAS